MLKHLKSLRTTPQGTFSVIFFCMQLQGQHFRSIKIIHNSSSHIYLIHYLMPLMNNQTVDRPQEPVLF